MSWSINAGMIGPGESVDWDLFWTSWPGAEYFVAKPVPTESGGLIVRTPTTLEVTTVSVTSHLDGSAFTYHIRVVNHGPWSTSYQIFGQGL
jgi:hypothetical protein